MKSKGSSRLRSDKRVSLVSKGATTLHLRVSGSHVRRTPLRPVSQLRYVQVSHPRPLRQQEGMRAMRVRERGPKKAQASKVRARRNPSRRTRARQDAVTCQRVTAMIRDYLAGELVLRSLRRSRHISAIVRTVPPSSIRISGPRKRYSPCALRTSLSRCKAACASSCGRRSSDPRPTVDPPARV